MFLWDVIAICSLSRSEKCGYEALELLTRASVQKIIQKPRERE